MKKKYILAALLTVFLLTAVVTAYALTWTRVRTWSNQVVAQYQVKCFTLPFRNAVSHRVSLRPLQIDDDLYVFGFNGTTVGFIGSSTNGGLTMDRVTFPQSTRTTYSSIIACARGWSAGTGTFSLWYDIGT